MKATLKEQVRLPDAKITKEPSSWIGLVVLVAVAGYAGVTPEALLLMVQSLTDNWLATLAGLGGAASVLRRE